MKQQINMTACPERAGSTPTITDVAKRCGVSIKTVSRVINHEAGVHPETRAQVLQVVAELKYRPKLSARSLAGARSFLIGLLYYDPSVAFVGEVQQGAILRCREAGYHLVVESLHYDAPDLAQQVGRMVSALQPDGMILTPPLCDNAAVLKALRDSQTACVLVSPERDVEGMVSVRMDDALAAEEMTRHLIALGHQRIAFIKGSPCQVASGLRFEGFQRAMKAHGLTVDNEMVCDGMFVFASGVAAGNKLFRQKERPTAVFASNDDMALGVLSVAHDLGLSVPDDVSIAGFDDAPAARLAWPPLTTIRQPKDAMARTAVDMLIAANRSVEPVPTKSAVHPVLPHELVVRTSTGAVKPLTRVPPKGC